MKAAVDKAKAEEAKKAKAEREKAKTAEKAKEKVKVDAEVAKKSDGVKALADAKLAKGEKDETIAKEALKKAMNLSDAEKAEMAQNKNLADQLGKEKMKEKLQQKEKEAYKNELKESKVVDEARIKKQKDKVEQLEGQE